nr:GNAT family N-acetyltransferase [Nocardioides aromaticivorans]
MSTVLSQVALRAVVPDDHELLVAVYAASRADELDQVAWPPGQREAFVRMQYDAQDRHYRAASPHGRFDVVEVDGRPAGRLYVDLRDDDVRIVDIALLPEFRGRGIGSALLRQVLAEAAAQGRTASIHVEVHNPAGALYERLGFRPVAERGVHRLLTWSAEGGLVAAVADRHEEEVDRPEVGVLDPADGLAEPVGAVEDERELVAGGPVGAGATEVRAEGGLDQHEGDPAAVGGGDREGLADASGEVVMGEPLHAATVPSRRN